MASSAQMGVDDDGYPTWEGVANCGDRLLVTFGDGTAYVGVASDGSDAAEWVSIPPALMMKLAVEVIKRYG